jgi:hypothetical protein
LHASSVELVESDPKPALATCNRLTPYGRPPSDRPADVKPNTLETQKTNLMYYRLRRTLRLFSWRHDTIYTAIDFLKRRRIHDSSKYDLLVEGYPRSANSSTAAAIRIANPNLRILSHQHTVKSVLDAIKAKKPVCLLIRNPNEAVASWIVHSNSNSFDALVLYIDYYSTLLAVADRLCVVEFSKTVKSPNTTLRKLNNKYSLNLIVPTAESEFLEAINKEVERLPWSKYPDKSSLPDDRRKKKIEIARRALDHKDYVEYLSEAGILFEQYRTYFDR